MSCCIHWFVVLQFLELKDLARLRYVSHELHDIIDDGRLASHFCIGRSLHNRIIGNWLPVIYVMNCAKRYSWSNVTVMDIRLLKYGWNWRSHPYSSKIICKNLIVLQYSGMYHCIVDGNYLRFKNVPHDRFMVLISREPYGVTELKGHNIDLNDSMMLLRLMC